MRAGLSSIQQTLTPEAATVLNHSIAEAARRNHGQTTPLHVAATLLSSPTGYLRQACIRSHPNSSHPLQCRALELCFSVALERLPTAQAAPGAAAEPPISNALMAALKRAQAHQRRGCPEQQQQPLLAVKVELEQLIISILDDPSVSRVMREASFSSPAVKATIEQSLSSTSNSHHSQQYHNQHQHQHQSLSFGGMNPRLVANSAPLGNRNAYLNPRLQQQQGGGGGDEVKKLLEIMGRRKKRNPVLVGDSEPEAVVKELLRKIEMGVDGILRNVEVVSINKGLLLSDKNQILARIKDLGGVVEEKIGSGRGVILDLGDLKWLVEQPSSFGGSQPEVGRAAVVEMANLVAKLRGDGGDEGSNVDRLWLIGTATCETYLRCQVYHSTMENDWDLQAVPIAPRSPLPGMFPRILSNPAESMSQLKVVPTPFTPLTRRVSENVEPGKKPSFCPQCSQNYDKELAKLASTEKSFSEAKQDASKSSLPQWLQTAKVNGTENKSSDQSQGKDGLLSQQKTQELQKKWRDTCLHLHPNFHQNNLSEKPGPPALSMTSLYNPALLSRQPFQPKLLATTPLGEAPQFSMLSRPAFQPKLQATKPLGEALQLNTTPVTNSPPGSPVRTDLVLGRKSTESTRTPSKSTENQAKDFLSCISSVPHTKLLDKFASSLDADTYKKLLKGLMEKAWWQAEAASAVASAVTRCSLGNGKPRGGGSRGDVWLLFTGPDRVGKKKMAAVLADQICGASPVTICLGTRRDDEDLDTIFRGKTAIDRIAEAVRRNPFSVIMLEDIDEADMLVRGSVKRAIERGRLADSHGREVGLGNAMFILTGDWSKTSPEAVRDGVFVDEKKLASSASGSWKLGLILREKNAKRRANWLLDEERQLKPRKEMGSGLSLDLNLAAADMEDERADGSHNSSDLTVDHEDELGLVNRHFAVASVPHDLANNVDDSIVFKPVNSAFVRREIKKTLSVKFSMVVDENLSIEVEDDVLEKIIGGLWHDKTSLGQWIEKAVSPAFEQLKPRLPAGDRANAVVRMVVESDGGDRRTSNGGENWLPSSILV